MFFIYLCMTVGVSSVCRKYVVCQTSPFVVFSGETTVMMCSLLRTVALLINFELVSLHFFQVM
jgi:hypothetical protein